jgi:metal-responsive CopG/Arc/MetJ family transcriptional regulator
MKTISIRVPEETDRRLAEEARIEGKRRSDLARDALDRYLDESERKRFMAGMVAAAARLAGDPEARAVEEDFAAADAEALEIAEGPSAADDEGAWWE